MFHVPNALAFVYVGVMTRLVFLHDRVCLSIFPSGSWCFPDVRVLGQLFFGSSAGDSLVSRFIARRPAAG